MVAEVGKSKFGCEAAVINEESKRRGRQLWVRIYSPRLTEDDLQVLVEEVWEDDSPVDVHATELVGTYDLKCPSESVHKKLKSRDSTMVNDHLIRITHKKLKMGTKDIFDFVLQRLKDLEEGRYGDRYLQQTRGRPRDQSHGCRREYSDVRGVSGKVPKGHGSKGHSSESSVSSDTDLSGSSKDKFKKTKKSNGWTKTWSEKPKERFFTAEPRPNENRWKSGSPRSDARAQSVGSRDSGKGKGKGKGKGAGHGKGSHSSEGRGEPT